MTRFQSSSAIEIPEHLYRQPHWFAFKTRSRAEKKVVEFLHDRGLEAYCPLVEEVREWADRTKRVAFPMFPGYVFSRLELTRLTDALRVPGVATVVRYQGRPTPVREEELDAVRRIERGVRETEERPTPVDFLEPGEEVVIIDGPFAGLTGYVQEWRGKARVAVRLTAIRQAVGIEMDRELLKAVA